MKNFEYDDLDVSIPEYIELDIGEHIGKITEIKFNDYCFNGTAYFDLEKCLHKAISDGLQIELNNFEVVRKNHKYSRCDLLKHQNESELNTNIFNNGALYGQ
jgi:hypothetical protein